MILKKFAVNAIWNIINIVSQNSGVTQLVDSFKQPTILS